jgi:hypothetical protein
VLCVGLPQALTGHRREQTSTTRAGKSFLAIDYQKPNTTHTQSTSKQSQSLMMPSETGSIAWALFASENHNQGPEICDLTLFQVSGWNRVPRTTRVTTLSRLARLLGITIRHDRKNLPRSKSCTIVLSPQYSYNDEGLARPYKGRFLAWRKGRKREVHNSERHLCSLGHVDLR